MVLSEIRTSTITSKGQIVIPSNLRSKEGFKSGQRVAILAFDDRLEVRPLQPLARQMDWETERKKTKQAIQKFVDKKKLRGKKIMVPSKSRLDQLAKDYLEKTQSG